MLLLPPWGWWSCDPPVSIVAGGSGECLPLEGTVVSGIVLIPSVDNC